MKLRTFLTMSDDNVHWKYKESRSKTEGNSRLHEEPDV